MLCVAVLHFIDRELGALREYATGWATDYLAPCEASFNIREACQRQQKPSHLQDRLYDRLSKISRLLSVDPGTPTSGHRYTSR